MPADKPQTPPDPTPRADKSKVLQPGGPAEKPARKDDQPTDDERPQTHKIISDGTDG